MGLQSCNLLFKGPIFPLKGLVFPFKGLYFPFEGLDFPQELFSSRVLSRGLRGLDGPPGLLQGFEYLLKILSPCFLAHYPLFGHLADYQSQI